MPYIGSFDQIDTYLEHNLVDEIVIMLDDYTTDLYKKSSRGASRGKSQGVFNVQILFNETGTLRKA